MRRASVISIVIVLMFGACTQEGDPELGRGATSDRTKRDGAQPDRRERRKERPKPSPSLGDTPPALDERPWWKGRIDGLLKKKPFSVQVRLGGETIYSDGAQNDRVPASVQKLVLSMALFDELGPEATLPTRLSAKRRKKSIVEGDLWVLGSGDPTVAGNPHFISNMPQGGTNLQELVDALRREGISEIHGNVMASTGPFARDWYAPGWRPYFPTSEVGLPSALTFNGNVFKERYTKKPERALAESLRNRLRRAGIVVTGGAGFGPAPRGLHPIASVPSPPLSVLARYMNRQSSNFFAEVLGKLLGAERFGPPGTIVKGARAIMSFAQSRGVTLESHDSSGLSYDNRMETAELVSLIEAVGEEPWVGPLRQGLASGGEGTLEDRLHNVRVRAKTGTLVEISALAGWVWLTKTKQWAEFAIISRGIDKSSAVKIEDAIVRTLYRSAS